MKSALNVMRRKSPKRSPRESPRPIFRRKRRRQPLRFTPYAWAKLLYLRDLGDTEVGGFGISRNDDLLLIEDIRLVRQRCSAVSVRFDDAAVADFFDEQVDLGRRVEQFARAWIHTHPANSAQPSDVDEETFARCFGRADWAVMCILARGGERYGRLRFGVGPGGQMRIPVEVDFTPPFPAACHDTWEEEYQRAVEPLGFGADMLLQDEAGIRAWPPLDEDDWPPAWPGELTCSDPAIQLPCDQDDDRFAGSVSSALAASAGAPLKNITLEKFS